MACAVVETTDVGRDLDGLCKTRGRLPVSEELFDWENAGSA